MKKAVYILLPLLSLSIGGIACVANAKRNTISVKNEFKKSDDVDIEVSSFKEGHEKDKLNDGNFNTYWEAKDKNNATIKLDLKEVRILKNVTQVFAIDDIWYFKIEASLDNETYFTLLDNSFGVYGKTFSESINGYARYIRLTIDRSEKGYTPTSKEFYVDSELTSAGVDVAFGLDGEASTSSHNFAPSKAFDGDHGTYWCRGSGTEAPYQLSGTWDTPVIAKSIELTFQDHARYNFDIIIHNEETNNDETIVDNAYVTGNFFHFDLAKETKISKITYNVHSDATSESGDYWASLAELKVIGFEDITSELGTSYCYIDRIESKNNDLQISDNNQTYHYINDKNVHSIALNVLGLDKEDKVYGYPVDRVLNYNLDGKTNTYLDEDHHMSYATKPLRNASAERKYYQSENKGETAYLLFDLGNTSIITRFLQDFHERAPHSFYIETSLDGKNFEKCYTHDSSEADKECECKLRNAILARYIRLTITPKDDETYATSDRFYIYGIGSTIRENWWQNTSGVIRFYPKLQPTTLKEITDRLDEFRYSGYRVIELHQLYEGVANIWAGLGGTDNYQIDPIIGNFADLNNLLTKAHNKGMKVFMFGNVGYGKYNSDIFLKASKDFGMGIDSKEANMFRFSKSIPTIAPGQDPNDPHLDPARWFYSDVAHAYYYEYWQRGGDIPTFNFENTAWQEECANYINFWADSGIDGIALDAPSVYDFGNIPEPGSARDEYEKRCSDITFKCITHKLRKNNLFSIPEGNGETKYIGDYKYRAVQNYNMTSWGGGAQSLGIIAAREHLGANNIDKWAKSVHDEAVGLGGVAVNGMNFEDVYDTATPTERILEAALATTTGHMSFLHLGSDAKIGQDIMKNWPLDCRLKIARSFALQNSLSALNPSGERKVLSTNDNGKYYAFYRADMHSNNKAMVLFNYQNENKIISVDLENTPLINEKQLILYDAYNDETLDITSNNGVISIPCQANSHRVLIWR